ncbi:hypothetical protein [Endozoicomonas euniceicola]|uniref:Uncharacterized protein n=1 Tax=Endozoicomonas euniceicola TaxID=1234143 RepID=A0ABY6GZN2_9GAMM|nr:hypothetical protein [Endozoicomonas euniceicola]UYM17501.1 hypothetical protein NX720_06175 [Endozoicomonas euniceicola]
MSSGILPKQLSLFILLAFCSGSLFADEYFYKMQITIAGNTSVFYVRSQNILQDREDFSFGMGKSGHVATRTQNPLSGSIFLESYLSTPEPLSIRGRFSTNSGEEEDYVLTPVKTLPSGITETIEVDNNSYQLLPNILHRLGKQQIYGRTQYSRWPQWPQWPQWLPSCSSLFRDGENSSQEASLSDNAVQLATGQPHSNSESPSEWRIRFHLHHSQENPQQPELESFLNMMNGESSQRHMQLVSLLSSPRSLITSSSGAIMPEFRAYLPGTITDEDQAMSDLRLAELNFSAVTLHKVSSQPLDNEDNWRPLDL